MKRKKTHREQQRGRATGGSEGRKGGREEYGGGMAKKAEEIGDGGGPWHLMISRGEKGPRDRSEKLGKGERGRKGGPCLEKSQKHHQHPIDPSRPAHSFHS